MAKLVKITGVNQIRTRLLAFNAGLGVRFERGLKRGGLFLQRETQKIVPIDKALLVKSARTVKVKGTGFSADIVMHYGAGANYAIYVHEDLEAKHAPGKQAKFVEQPAREKRSEIINEIYQETKGF